MKKYIVSGRDIVFTQPDFDLDHTLDCGQAFRWEKAEGGYVGAVGRKELRISQDGDTFTLHDVSEDGFAFWSDYFDLDTDYGEIKKRLSTDSTLEKACAYGSGIRLLRQPAEETLLSFIISQNNNIPRIKGIISRLCDIYGGFPEASEMTGADVDTLAPLRAGFRAKYLIDCVQKLHDGTVDLGAVRSMPLDEAAAALMQIKGVGIKVAMCTLLFGFHRTDAYPVDVWMKRVNENFYPDGLPECTRGIEGIAQQYLFYAIRNGII